MSRELIACDIDDVLALNAQGFVEFSNREFGTSLSSDDYQEHWAEMWQVDLEEVDRRAQVFHESEVVATYKHIKESVVALDGLKDIYRLVAVTSRRSNLKSCTRAWLDTYFNGVFEDIYFAGIFDGPIDGNSHLKTKADVFRKLRPDYVIDDQIKHCEAAARLDARAVLFGEYPWNEAASLPPGVTRCKDWPAVLRYFDGIN